MQENPQASQRHACASNNASVNREYENVTFMGRVSLSLYLPLSPSSPLYSDTVYIQKKNNASHSSLLQVWRPDFVQSEASELTAFDRYRMVRTHGNTALNGFKRHGDVQCTE